MTGPYITVGTVIAPDDEITPEVCVDADGDVIAVVRHGRLSIQSHYVGQLRRLAEALIDAEDQADLLRAVTPTTAAASEVA